MNHRSKLATALLYLISAIVVVLSVYPFIYAISTSLKTGTALFNSQLIPSNADLRNYVALFEGVQPFGKSLLNSIAVAVLTVGFAMLMGVTAAYALGRIRFKGKGLLLVCILGVSMFPQVAVLSGMFELVRFLGLYDSLGALVVSYTTFSLPFTIWVLTTFMKNIPVELEEAAIVDGASLWVIITKVFAPIMGPALVTTGLLAFIGAWNEFMFALTFVISGENRTVPVAIALLQGASQYELPWGSIMAASVTVTLPIIVMVLIFQKRIVGGLTAGAVKG